MDPCVLILVHDSGGRETVAERFAPEYAAEKSANPSLNHLGNWRGRQRGLRLCWLCRPSRLRLDRAIATRYDKHDANFLASVKLAAIRIWMRFNESVP